MGHAAPISLEAGCFRQLPRRPGVWLGLFGGGTSAARSAKAPGAGRRSAIHMAVGNQVGFRAVGWSAQTMTFPG
jgi:hypothetical protein